MSGTPDIARAWHSERGVALHDRLDLRFDVICWALYNSMQWLSYGYLK